MKQNLGLTSGFPSALTLNPSPKLVVPAISFDKTAHSLNNMLINHEIYVTPTDKFQIKLRDIFTDTMLTHYSGKEARRSLSGPNMNLWNEQLNWAVWCSTSGCGISSQILFQDKMADGVHDLTDSELHLPPQIRSFFRFHVYFTIRRLLFELGGIQNTFALPGDPTFNKNNNRYDLPSYKRLCNEFKIDPNTDFRFKKGSNHGLDEVLIYYSYEGYVKTSYDYPNKTMKFSDSGGKAEAGNLIQYIENTLAKKQYEYFIPSDSHGLTSAAPKKNWNDLSVLSTLSIRPSNSHGKSLKPQSLFSISTFLSKTTNWQPVSTTNPQIRTVTYCTRLPTHLTSKTQFRTPNFSDSVGSAAKIQTLTPNATKCPISFPNVAIRTASCLKHSIGSKTSIENRL